MGSPVVLRPPHSQRFKPKRSFKVDVSSWTDSIPLFVSGFLRWMRGFGEVVGRTVSVKEEDSSLDFPQMATSPSLLRGVFGGLG